MVPDAWQSLFCKSNWVQIRLFAAVQCLVPCHKRAGSKEDYPHQIGIMFFVQSVWLLQRIRRASGFLSSHVVLSKSKAFVASKTAGTHRGCVKLMPAFGWVRRKRMFRSCTLHLWLVNQPCKKLFFSRDASSQKGTS